MSSRQLGSGPQKVPIEKVAAFVMSPREPRPITQQRPSVALPIKKSTDEVLSVDAR